ncbi:MAG: type II secretion system F family protein, partial [Hungatella sp.]
GTRIGIQKGGTLSDAMRAESHVFPAMLIHMVEAGEASGNLDIAFDRMATQFEKEAKLKTLTQKAMIYPSIVSVVSVGVVIIMLTFVIPKFMSMFEGMDIEMPAITLAVVNLSNFAVHYWYLLVTGVVFVVLALRTFQRSDFGKGILDHITLKLPLIGKLVTKTACARFTRTLSTLLAAGIPLMDALEMTARTMSNVWFRKALMGARDEVSKGIELAEPLQRCGIFPPMVYHMVGIGEKTGNIEEMLNKMADYYDEEVEAATAALMAAMEPLIVVVVAAIVGILILAVMAPITAMYQGLDSI